MIKQHIKHYKAKRGVALLAALLLVTLALSMGLAMGLTSYNQNTQAKTILNDRQATYLAEAGWQKARQALTDGVWTASVKGSQYTGTLGSGNYSVTLTDNGDNTYDVSAQGYIGDSKSPLAQRTITEKSIPLTGSEVNLSVSALAAVSSVSGKNDATRLNDQKANTKWVAGSKGSGAWLTLQYSEATKLDAIVVKEHNNVDGMSVEVSEDGETWSSLAGATLVEGKGAVWSATFPETAVTYLRLTMTSVPKNKKAALKEVETYNTSIEGIALGTGRVNLAW